MTAPHPRWDDSALGPRRREELAEHIAALIRAAAEAGDLPTADLLRSLDSEVGAAHAREAALRAALTDAQARLRRSVARCERLTADVKAADHHVVVIAEAEAERDRARGGEAAALRRALTAEARVRTLELQAAQRRDVAPPVVARQADAPGIAPEVALHWMRQQRPLALELYNLRLSRLQRPEAADVLRLVVRAQTAPEGAARAAVLAELAAALRTLRAMPSRLLGEVVDGEG